MGKIAFVFSGQGAQYSGMGKDLYDHSPAAAAMFRRLDELRPGTADMCFSGTAEELAQTANTQPCMFAMELAAAEALKAAGIPCHAAAGFSLGEISALAFTGVVTPEEGFRLVCIRGKLMQLAAEKAETGMAAVLKLEPAQVEELCKSYVNVFPVNYNCPGQISVAGAKDELADFYRDVKAAGGRALPLKVAGAFHSPYMAEAASKFKTAVEQAQLNRPEIPLYSDYTSKLYEGEEEFPELLSKQICNPVRWQAIIEDMNRNGIDSFVEIGPGKTLCGFTGKILGAANTFHVEDEASLRETIEGVTAC